MRRWLIPALFLATASPAFAADNGMACKPDTGGDEPKPTSFLERTSLTGDWGGARDDLEKKGITLGLMEQSELWANLGGGRRRGGTYNGLTTMSLAADLEALAGWTGGSFFVNAFQIHGRGPTPNLVNSLQPPSSIEATRATRLYNLWFDQVFPGNQLCIRIGKGAASDEFMLSRNATALMNSAFGFPTLAAYALPSAGPNYPLSTPFVRLKYQASDNFTFMAGLYNGDPVGRSGPADPQLRDPSGTDFRFRDDAFLIMEGAYATDPSKDARYPGIYRFGFWFHSGRFNDQAVDINGISLANPYSSGLPRQHRDNYALYALFDQTIWHPGDDKDRGIGIFGLITGSPFSDRNLIDFSFTAGINWKGPLPDETRKDDVLALGIAHARLGSSVLRYGDQLVRYTGTGRPFHAAETVLEASYTFQATGWMTIQPDIQHIIHPNAGMPNGFDNGNRRRLPNATIIGVRVGVTF